jgi:ankyrin repeat protein
MSDVLPPQDQIDEFVGSAHGDLSRVQEMLTAFPALLTAAAVWGETAIEAAAQTGRVDIAEYLLAAGAPLSICTAAMLGRAEEVQAYLAADPSAAHARGAHGIPALYHAVIRGHQAIAERLLAAGADVNADEGGSPALHGAVLFRQRAMVEWLLAHGANVNAKNRDGKTSLKVAAQNNLTEMADLLRRRGGAE